MKTVASSREAGERGVIDYFDNSLTSTVSVLNTVENW